MEDSFSLATMKISIFGMVLAREVARNKDVIGSFWKRVAVKVKLLLKVDITENDEWGEAGTWSKGVCLSSSSGLDMVAGKLYLPRTTVCL